MRELVADQQGLYLAQFERPQHSTQPRYSAGIALSLADHLPRQFFAALLMRLAQNATGLLFYLLIGDASEIRRKMAEQNFLDVGMQLSFELMPAGLVAT